MPILEVACFSAKSAAIACEAGADRIELCRDCHAGGTTPSRESVFETVELARRSDIPVYVMIRPRDGDFVYSATEYEEMKTRVCELKDHVDGFVMGILTKHHNVDVDRVTDLVDLAYPVPCTFHRAFDQTRDQVAALDDIIATGCKAVLTSGGTSSAPKGAEVVATLVRKAAGNIQIIPGGGVRSKNLAALQKATHATCYHTSALIQDSETPDVAEITRMLAILRKDNGYDSPLTASPTPPSDADNNDERIPEDMNASAVSIGPNALASR